MTELCLIGADCEAFGHPTECTEPAPGNVNKTSDHNVTVTVSGQTKQVATLDSANMFFSSHAHDHDATNGCHDYASHTLDPSGSSSLTINGSPIYLVEDAVTSDPKTNGDVDIVQNPFATNLDDL